MCIRDRPGTMVFLGISTINLEIAKLIYQKNLNITLVTNMIDIMKLFTNESSTRCLLYTSYICTTSFDCGFF